MNKKLILGLSLLPLALTSCGKTGYLGLYSFQMGKNSGAHALASMTLTDEDHIAGGKTLGKKMKIYGEMRTTPVSSESSSTSEEGEDFSGGLASIFEKGISIDGYYSVGDALSDGRNAFKIGFDFSEFLKEISDEPMIIDNETIEQFVYCEIDSRKIYLRIPVSFTDLEYQLYWYGNDLPWLSDLDEGYGDNSEDSSEASVELSSKEEEGSSEEESSVTSEEEIVSHPVGSKPTKEEIDKINETYPASHGGKKFRNFYTVSLALTRQ